jgi:hypothetical protein
MGMCPVYAKNFVLPAPGVMVHLSPEFNPPILKGIKVHPDNPLRFDFIMDVGDGSKPSHNGRVVNPPLREESIRLIKYFLTSLTIPEKDLWVNLSPYEKDRIIPQSFGLTEMGRDLLAEDYMLKQITASLIYPEDEIGKRFWKRIYEEAARRYGTTNIPVDTFNKVWIVPEKAVVYENAKAGTAYVVEAKLKVMLEQDYLALSKNNVGVGSKPTQERAGYEPAPTDVNQLGSQIVREIVIPELTTEINENKNFTQLRQVYNSLILATWYKKKIKDSILEQVYADKNKVAGVNIDDPQEKEKIYQRYLQAFKKGVFNYIKEEISYGPDSGEQGIFPRKYFSGGTNLDLEGLLKFGSLPVNISSNNAMIVKMETNPVQEATLIEPGLAHSNGSTSLVFPVGNLFEDKEASGPNLISAIVLKFEGVGRRDVYNGVFFQAKIHPEDKQKTTIFAGRVEGRWAESTSQVMFFQQGDDGKWNPIKGAPVFENSQDPSVKKIGDKLIVSMVKVKDTGKINDNGSPILVWYTEFFQFDSLMNLDSKEPIARGPLGMKDIRLIELQDGRILIMTRPQGKTYDKDYGQGKIAYFIVDSFEEFVKFSEGGKEESTLTKMMENGKVLEGMFRDDQWGGTNALHLLQNGNVGVLGHIARHNKKGNREYCPITFEFDPNLGKVSSLKLIGRWKTLAKLLSPQRIPIKKLNPKQPLDLANVWWGTDLILGKSRYFISAGLRDSRMGVIETTAPFTSPIADVDPSDWSTVENLFVNRGRAALAQVPKKDAAPAQINETGGIDLTPANMNLQTQNAGEGIKFHMDPAQLAQLQNAPGFVPVIISIKPMTDLALFLGLN